MSQSAEPTGASGGRGGAPSADGGIVTPAAGTGSAECGDHVSGADSEVGGDVTGIQGESAEFADYLTLSAAELREICDERGIGYKKNAGVKALAALLEADDDAALPELLAAEPVEA